MTVARFQFHAELNRFLAPAHRSREFVHAVPEHASVKHMIEALGVPHTEVGAIAVDGRDVDFTYRIADGDFIEVHAAGTPGESASRVALRPAPEARFIADAHLGQLARDLRMLGFDTVYRNDYSDADIARIASEENRVVLTRDRDLLIRKDIVHGCFVHATKTEEQVVEVVRRFRLQQTVRTFSRCLRCNAELRTVNKAEVEHKVPPFSREAHEHFQECQGCARVYWEGSHVRRMRLRLARMLGAADA